MHQGQTSESPLDERLLSSMCVHITTFHFSCIYVRVANAMTNLLGSHFPTWYRQIYTCCRLKFTCNWRFLAMVDHMVKQTRWLRRDCLISFFFLHPHLENFHLTLGTLIMQILCYGNTKPSHLQRFDAFPSRWMIADEFLELTDCRTSGFKIHHSPSHLEGATQSCSYLNSGRDDRLLWMRTEHSRNTCIGST